MPHCAPLSLRVFAADDLPARLDAPWRALAAAATVPNPFYGPAMLRAALAHLRGRADVHLWTWWRDARTLVGLVPVEHRWTWEGLGLPLPHRTAWRSPYTYLTAPLVRPGHARAVMADLAAPPPGTGPACLTRFGVLDPALLSGGGPASWTVQQSAAWDRPLLDCRGTLDDHLARALKPKKRRELARQRRKLAELGPVRHLQPQGPAAAAAVQRFLALEHAGWKGREGTSFRALPHDEAFLVAAMAAAAADGGLRCHELWAGDRLVASKLDLVSGDTAFGFKIAFDERVSRLSPGVLLELDTMAQAFADPGLARIDSCAAPGSGTVHRLWPDRRAVVAVELLPPGARGRLGARMVQGLSAGSARVRREWRQLDPAVKDPLRRFVRRVA